MDSSNRLATLVDWYAAPDLVTVDQSAFLLGVSPELILQIVEDGGAESVDTDDGILVDKHSLREFWEIYMELLDADARDNDRIRHNTRGS